MNKSYLISNYKQAAIKTNTNPTQHLLSIFEESIKILYKIQQAFIKRDIEAKFKLVNRLTNALYYLRAELSRQELDEIATTLDNFCSALIYKLELLNSKLKFDDETQEILQQITGTVRNMYKTLQTVA